MAHPRDTINDVVPIFCSAASSNSSPAADDWLPPSKSTVSFVWATVGRSKGSGVKLVLMAVSLGARNDCDRTRVDWLRGVADAGANGKPDMVAAAKPIDAECRARFGVPILD